MKNLNLMMLSIIACFSVAATRAQVEVDKPIQLTGGAGERVITNLELPVNGTDAVNKDYVDAAIPASRLFVGDYYQGGVVVFVDSTKQHGIIGAKSIQSTGPGIPWSNVTSSAVGVSAQSKTDGAANTVAIINQPGHSSSAAKLCDDYAGGGYTDWYLPAANELSSACRQQGLFMNLSFYTKNSDYGNGHPLYSSSTENSTSPSDADVIVHFGTCEQHWVADAYGNSKSMQRKVWCVRKF